MKRLAAFAVLLLGLSAFAQAVTGTVVVGSGGASLPTGGLSGQRLIGPTASPAWSYGSGCTANSSGEVNVVDCGADPSNVITSAAQSTAFQAAINTGAKRVVVPDGTYSLATGLTVPSDGTGQNVAGWEIVGLGQPHIILTSALNAVALDISKQRYAVVKNLWIDSTGTKSDANSTVGIKFEGDSSRVVVEHNRVENFSLAGVQLIQPLVLEARNNVINSNNYGYDLEKFVGAVPTTVNVYGGYVTANLRGYYADGQVGGTLDGVTFESNGSSSTNDAAVQFNTGSRGISMKACYFEANNRNFVFTDARSTRLSNTYIGSAPGADVFTWSGVSTTNRANTEITNDTVSTGHITADPNGGIDLDMTMARTGAAAAGTIKYSNSQTTSWRNNVGSGDLNLGVNASDRLTFGGVALLTTSSTDTLTNKTLTAPVLGSGTFATLTSTTANPAASGSIRLANNSDSVSWRNFANTASLPLKVNGSDQLTFNGAVLATGAGNIPLATVTATGDLIVATGSGAVSALPIGSTGQVLTVAGGTAAWSTPASSGMSLSLSWPMVPDNGNGSLSGNFHVGGDLDGNGSATFLGHVGASQFTTAHSWLDDRYLALNLGTLTPAYVLHSLGQARIQAIADPAAPTVQPVGVGAPVQAQTTGTPQTLTFSNAGTITRSSGSWTSDNYILDASVIVTGSASNNATFRITGVTSTVLTVTPNPVNETATTGALASGGFGRTSYSLVVGCRGPFGGVTKLSSAGSTALGPAALSSSDYIAVSWTIPAGSPSCDVYLTDGTHLLGNVVAPANSFSYTGQTPSTVTAIAYNSTADTQLDGALIVGTTDSSGTPGAATASTVSGQGAVAASASSVVITNPRVTSTSRPFAQLQANDATCTSIKSAVPGAGTVTVTTNAACTGSTKFGWFILQ